MSGERNPRDVTAGLAPVREEVLCFGEDDRVVAILTPPAGPAAPTTPAVVLLNAGVLHRIGPHRLHVSLARRLAANGFAALRVDLSGIGDSAPAPGASTFRESAVADTRAAMDRLGQRLGVTQFVLFGVCSGADNAMATAAVDNRVIGLALIDSYSYATTSSRLREELDRVRRMRAPRDVARWAGHRLGAVGARLIGAGRRAAGAAGPDSPSGGAPHEETQEGRVAPTLDVYRSLMAGLLDRQVAMLTIFTGALHERYNDADQIFEWIPEARGRIERSYFPAATHTFTESSSREQLLAAVTTWMGPFNRAAQGASRGSDS